MMKIVVTGGAGYIGSVLVPTLLKRGYDVLVVDNFMYSQPSLLDCCHDKRFTVVRGDVRDEGLMGDVIKDAHAIFPLACLTGAPACKKDPVGARTTNYDAVKMLLKLRKPSQLIIFPTTNSGYGIGEKGNYCTEETPLMPTSLYGRLKVEIEKEILASGNAITLRLATAFGISSRMRLDLLVNDFTYRALRDRFIVLFEPGFRRNFIHVKDVAEVFMHCLNNFKNMKNEAYNIGLNNANLSKRELCEEIKKEISNFHFMESKIGKDVDKRDYIVSNEKIGKTGFKAKVSLREGIKELIKGYEIIHRNQYSNA